MKKFILILMTTLMVSGLQAQTIKETIRGKNGELQGTAVTTVRGNKSVTVYKDKYGKITGRSESTTNSQGKPHTVYRDQYGQRTGTSTTSIKNSATFLADITTLISLSAITTSPFSTFKLFITLAKFLVLISSNFSSSTTIRLLP